MSPVKVLTSLTGQPACRNRFAATLPGVALVLFSTITGSLSVEPLLDAVESPLGLELLLDAVAEPAWPSEDRELDDGLGFGVVEPAGCAVRRVSDALATCGLGGPFRATTAMAATE